VYLCSKRGKSVNSESFSSCRRTLKPEPRGQSASLHYLHFTEASTCTLAHHDFQVGGIVTADSLIVRHGGRNWLLGGSARSQPASLPCASVSLLQLLQQDRDSSARRAPRQPPKTFGGVAPSYNPQGIECSHRRKPDLKPVLLDIDQLIDSAAPSILSVTSVRTRLIQSPTNSRARGCLSMSPEKVLPAASDQNYAMIQRTYIAACGNMRSFSSHFF
jgi:hypothetical protein